MNLILKVAHMKRIPLTRGLFALVDDEDYERLAPFKWSVSDYKHPYAVRYQGKRKVGMANEIWPRAPGTIIDHANRNTLDNRKANLRPATRSMNSVNWPRQNRHGRGVSKRWGVFNARITVAGKRVNLGSYSTAYEARAAYDYYARKWHGVFAQLNHPNEQGAPPQPLPTNHTHHQDRGGEATTGFRGIQKANRPAGNWTAKVWNKSADKWRYLGTFDTAEQAARAYDRAATNLFGKSARLNFPED